MMAVYTVDSLQDNTIADDGYTTIREAVATANASGGADVIQFASSLTQNGPATIGLSLGELQLNDDITLNGPGSDTLTIDAQGNSRVFRIGWQTDATIHGLTITGGGNVDAAAGIYGDTDSNLTLNSVRVTGNSTLRTASYDVGGGLYGFWGSLHIIDSTIDHNYAHSGGGVMFIAYDSQDTLEITNSTISENEGRDLNGNGEGGGLLVLAYTGADPQLTITNSTFSGNVSGDSGGIRVGWDAHLVINNSTITDNSATNSGYGYIGGIGISDSQASVELHNSIVAANNSTTTDWRDLGAWAGSFDATSSYNLIGMSGLSGLINGVNGNIAGTGWAPIDPLLAPLDYYGGVTKTHVPMRNSSAIDSGYSSIVADLSTDQRGFARATESNVGLGAQVDIGAVEVQFASTMANGSAVGPGEFVGTDSADTITVTSTYLTLNGQTFPISQLTLITIYGFGGNDLIDASATNKLLHIDGGDGDDVLKGGSGNDAIIGGSGNDTMYGGLGNDTYFFEGSALLGTDTIHEAPNEGLDFLHFAQITNASSTGLNLNLNSDSTAAVIGPASAPQLQLGALQNESIEAVQGTFYHDLIFGNDLDNGIYGSPGNDEIHGGPGNDFMLVGGPGSDTVYGDAGDDYLLGGPGDDVLYGGIGNDRLQIAVSSLNSGTHRIADGGAGDDTYLFVGGATPVAVPVDVRIDDASGHDTFDFSQVQAIDGVIADLSAAADAVQYTGLNVSVLNGIIEDVVGSRFNDLISGNDVANQIHGGVGDDVLYGADGDDILYGDAGSDSIDGGFGDDQFPVSPSDSPADDNYSDPDQSPEVKDQSGHTNHPPTIQPIVDRIIDAGSLLQFQILANDADEPTSGLQFSFDGPAHGATVSSSGLFSWTPAWNTSAQTEFTFRVKVLDTGTPQLQDTVGFSVVVLPHSPRNVEFGPRSNASWYKGIGWQSVEGAAGYIVERKLGDGEWVEVANTPYNSYYDSEQPIAFEISYRVQAYDGSNNVTPFSSPVTDYLLGWASTVPDSIESVADGNRIAWTSVPGVHASAYLVERLQSSDEGWIEVFRGVPSSSGTDQYYIIDSNAVPGTNYVYALSAVIDGLTSRRAFLQFSSIDPTAVDLTFNFENLPEFKPPQLLDTLDSQEESMGFFLPLNNNYDEGNTDTNGMPLADNLPDAIADNRVNIFEDRQVLGLALQRHGDAVDGRSTVTYEFPSAIKVWAWDYASYSPFEIQTGIAYSDDFPNSMIYETPMWIEAVDESQALRDVELKVTLAPYNNPSALQEDTIRFTIGNLRAELSRSIVEGAQELSAYVPIAPYTTEYDGETVELNLRRNGTVVETQQAVIQNGEVNATFTTQPISGYDYTVETVFRGQRGTSDPPPYEVNLTIDSNNDGFIHSDDDAVEDIAGQPGKWIGLNLYDDDHDRIPNYVDGYQWKHAGDFATSQDSGLVPIKISVGQLASSPNAKVRFTYNANDPLLGVQQIEVPAPNPRGYDVAGYTITDSGHLRIWNVDRFRIGTTPNWQPSPGNFLASGEDFTMSQLGTAVNGVYTLWVEAVLPSEAKGDLSIQVTVDAYGDGSLLLSDRIRLTAVGTKSAWQNQALNRAMINPLAWNPDRGIQSQEANIRKAYDYYKRTFLQDSNHLLWVGLARMAGGPVLDGVDRLKAQIDYNSNSLNPDAEPLIVPHIESLAISMIKMNKAVFDDIAWQHEAYLTGGVKALELLAEYSNSQDITPTNLADWQAIANGTPESIQVGNLDLLHREQFDVLQPLWDNLTFFEGVAVGWMARSPLPDGASFTAFYGGGIPTTSIADINNRWPWLRDDMVPKWVARTDAQRRELANADIGTQMGQL